MATIAGLYLYPIKSCGGIALQDAVLGACGLETHGISDREWMVVDEGGVFVTQRECPALARTKVSMDGLALGVSAPDLPALRIPLEDRPRQGERTAVTIWQDRVFAIDAGDEPANWFSRLLDRPVRLVRFDDREARLSNKTWTKGLEARTRFSDGYSMLLISRASLVDLNSRWCGDGKPPLPMDRFRPNLVIDGIGPYEEDHLSALTAGAIELRPVKPCPRCSIPSVDQSTGEVGPAPVELLASYRFNAAVGGAVFGQNVVSASGHGSVLRVGQHFTEQWNF